MSASDLAAGLLRACAASARVNEYLVEHLDPALWRAKPPAPKMRTIAAIVVHLHNCGLAYLRRAAPKVAVPPDLDRFKTTQAAAVRALGAKRRALVAVLDRGQIVWQARLLGYPISQQTMSGMWMWTTRGRESH